MGAGNVPLCSGLLKICFQKKRQKKITFRHRRLSGIVEHLMKAQNIDSQGPIFIHSHKATCPKTCKDDAV